MPLNHQQQIAASAPHDAPLKIIAGAGTGKTETLAARYVHLVQKGIDPERIVLLTFTEDAAAEMRARVMLRLREAHLQLEPYRLLHLWIATFHGFAMRLLHEYGFQAGLPPTPRLVSDDEQAEFWQTLRDQIEAAPQLANGYSPLDHSTYRWDNDEAWNKVLAVIGALRRGGGNPAELTPHPQLREQQTVEYAAHRAQLVPLIEHCFAAYSEHLRQRGVLDYDELLQAALRLVQSERSIGQRFDVVMVDEFQDTNRPQLDVLQQVQPTLQRTTVVGDPRQAIYGWNAARAESINEFPFAEEPLPPHHLSVNYRSHPAIVEVANLALAGSELGMLTPLRPASERSRSRPAALDERVVSLHLLPTVADEAQFIVDAVRNLHERGLDYRDMAVLLRSRTQLAVLLDALQTAGIPYIVNGGTGFYLDPLVRLTSSLLRLVADPADRAAWAHVLESPLIGLPPGIITVRGQPSEPQAPRPFSNWLDYPDAVLELLPDRPDVVERVRQFRTVFEQARSRWGLMEPGAYLEWLWQASGIMAAGWNTEVPQRKLVLRRLLRDADDYAAANPAAGIVGFAQSFQQRVEQQPRVAPPTAPTFDGLEIATVHQAKGREWPVVFVFNSALPGQRAGQVESVLWDERWGLVISGNGSKSGGDDPLMRLREDLRRRKRNEERSIWYVALTRAQERLFVLHSGCELTDGIFADAQAKLERRRAGQEMTKDDEAVHFFHELWAHLSMLPERSDVLIECTTLPSCSQATSR